jgi:uncharacterized protein YaiL (DUF2058 family)
MYTTAKSNAVGKKMNKIKSTKRKAQITFKDQQRKTTEQNKSTFRISEKPLWLKSRHETSIPTFLAPAGMPYPKLQRLNRIRKTNN